MGNASGPMTDTDARKRKLNAELANGRLAMMAIIGMFYQDGLTGSAWGDWSLFVDSPLRAVTTQDASGRTRFITGDAPITSSASSSASAAVEKWQGEIGATFPLCNPAVDGASRWDPCGFTRGKNAAKFDQYRAAELKHGRVAMMATFGLVAQHYFRFKGLSFNDGVFDLSSVPSNLGAISTFPGSAARRWRAQ